MTTSVETVELRFQNRGRPRIRQQQPIASTADRGGNNFFIWERQQYFISKLANIELTSNHTNH